MDARGNGGAPRGDARHRIHSPGGPQEPIPVAQEKRVAEADKPFLGYIAATGYTPATPEHQRNRDARRNQEADRVAGAGISPTPGSRIQLGDEVILPDSGPNLAMYYGQEFVREAYGRASNVSPGGQPWVDRKIFLREGFQRVAGRAAVGGS